MLVEDLPSPRHHFDKKRQRHSYKVPPCIPTLFLCEQFQASSNSSGSGSPRINRSYSSRGPTDKDSLQDGQPPNPTYGEDALDSPSFLSLHRRSPSAGGQPLIFNVGDYRVSEKLGKGSAGTVYLAYHTGDKDQPPVAIKMIDKNAALKHDPLMEARILQTLKHKNIIKLQEYKENEHRICLVMEYAENGDMLQYLRKLNKSCFPESDARRIFKQIIAAVNFAHLQGYAHRDIKPENILFDGASLPNALLGDFSHSSEWSPRRRTSSERVGTYIFSAPETLAGPCSVGPEADIWSCGVVLYYMLSGRMPFEAKDSMGVLRKMQKGQWASLNKWISKPARKLVARMLEPNPLKRINMIDILNHQWLKKDEKKEKKKKERRSRDRVMVLERPRSNSADMLVMKKKPIRQLYSIQE